jgi:aspartate/methionine/tyrosine aminotransferase
LAPSDGAFYLYADVSHMTESSPDLCQALLSKAGVAVTPGIDFDPENGHRFIRFSFAGSTEDIIEAMRRMKVWNEN